MIKINVREFRKNLAKYLSLPVIILNRGKKVATVRPAKGYQESKNEKQNNNKTTKNI